MMRGGGESYKKSQNLAGSSHALSGNGLTFVFTLVPNQDPR